jgi:hypothetical protein
MRTLTRRHLIGLWLASGLAASACLSPTLPPLPPPVEPSLSYVSEGQLQLSGYVSTERSARVIAVNANNDHVAGAIVRDGDYRFVIAAQPGDNIELWYEVGVEVSDSVFLTAPPYEADSTPDAGSPAPADAGSGLVDAGNADTGDSGI